MEYLFLFPVLLIVDQVPLWLWLVSLMGLLFIGVLYRIMLPNQRWWIYVVVSVFVGILPGYIFAGNGLFIGLLAIIQPVTVYRGMMYVDRTKETLLPVSYLWGAGFAVYFIGYFVFRFIDILHPYLTVITICGVVLVGLTLFISNSNRLKSATLSKKHDPNVNHDIKSKNRFFLIATFVIIVLIANARVIQEVLWNAFKATVQWILGIMSGSGSEEMIEESPPPSVEAPQLPFEEGEPSFIAKFMETIVMYTMYAIMLVGAIVLLLLVKKTRDKLIKAFRSVILFLKQMVKRSAKQEETTQYMDEKENIFSWDAWKREQQNKVKGLAKYFKRGRGWQSLSNQQKVRHVYREFLLQEMEKNRLSSIKYAKGNVG